MAEDGGILTEPQTSWTDNISEENRAAVKDFTSADALAHGYGQLFTKLGDHVKMPDDKSTDEERSAFYQKLGAKKTGGEYTRPQLVEGQKIDEDFYNYMTSAAAECGASDNHLSFLMQKYITYQGIAIEKQEAMRVAREDADDKQMHDDWGVEYDKNTEIARRALDELTPEEIKEPLFALLKEKGMEFNPLFKRLLHSMGSKMMDDTLVKGSLPKPKEGYTPQYPDSPEMYAGGEDEESKKARAYFEAKGHKY